MEGERETRDGSRVPSDNKPTPPNDLRDPENAIGQAYVRHIDDVGDSREGTYPEYGGCKKLDDGSYEADFLPAGSEPFPFLVWGGGA
jgi:hypothetical protein